MLQQDRPDDYVIATGQSHSVQEFLEAVFHYVELDWRQYVSCDPYYYRAAEVDHLLGDASKARKVLGWTPRTDFAGLVGIMTEHDLQLAKREAHAERFESQTKGV
jgi:GDPmannose 4,6-dehydratase